VRAVGGFAATRNPIFGEVQHGGRVQLHRFLPVSLCTSTAVS